MRKLAVAAVGLLLAGCSSSTATDRTTLTVLAAASLTDAFTALEKKFEADHPGVDVEVQAMAHEDMVDKLEAAFQSGDVPDVYMERGGGELADHVEAGLVRDLSEDAAEEVYVAP